VLPGWLEPPVIGERQGGIRDRLEEVRARLQAAADAPPPAPANPPASAAGNASVAPPPQDPRQQKLLERVKAALPAIGEASAAMDQARQALAGKQVKPALEHEQAAIAALGRAIEQFSDLKQLVELAWAEHQALLQLLAPEAAKQLDAATRSRQTHELLSHNLGRMPRIAELITDELAQLDQQAKQVEAKAAAAGPAPGAGPGTGSGSGAGSGAPDPQKAQIDQAKQQLEQARQQMQRAQELRGKAAAALAALDKALAGTVDPMPPARQADTELTELRKLFFSVIEHLQELIRDQGETRDQTSAASGEDDFTRGPKLPGLVDRQDGHGRMAKAITDALAQQADAAGKGPQQGPPQGPQQGPDPKALAAAADEVRQSQGEMADARATLVKARDSKTASESLAPSVKSQGKAIEHLENALKLLQPPPKKNDKNDKSDKDQQQQQQQQQKQKQDQQPQQGGAGQRARDEDARRQRERRDRDAQSDPVEKDW
jgi:hypothetical protein